MIELLNIKRLALTSEDAAIVKFRKPHAASEYTRMQMMTADFEEWSKKLAGVSTCGASEEAETHRDNRL